MTGEGIPKRSTAPGPVPQPKPKPDSEPTTHSPVPQPRSGSGADTALEAMIRKRLMGAGHEPTVPGDGCTKGATKRDPGV